MGEDASVVSIILMVEKLLFFGEHLAVLTKDGQTLDLPVC